MSNAKPVAVVSGVGPGTGAALARHFARGGYAVAMLAPEASVRWKYSSIPSPVSMLALGDPDCSSCTGLRPFLRTRSEFVSLFGIRDSSWHRLQPVTPHRLKSVPPSHAQDWHKWLECLRNSTHGLFLRRKVFNKFTDLRTGSQEARRRPAYSLARPPPERIIEKPRRARTRVRRKMIASIPSVSVGAVVAQITVRIPFHSFSTSSGSRDRSPACQIYNR